nr:MAG: excisionase [Caldicoprobacter oshimai]
MNEKAVYNVQEVAKLLDINVTKAYELVRRRDFPALRIGKRIVIPKKAFEKWLDETAVKEKEV